MCTLLVAGHVTECAQDYEGTATLDLSLSFLCRCSQPQPHQRLKSFHIGSISAGVDRKALCRSVRPFPGSRLWSAKLICPGSAIGEAEIHLPGFGRMAKQGPYLTIKTHVYRRATRRIRCRAKQFKRSTCTENLLVLFTKIAFAKNSAPSLLLSTLRISDVLAVD